MILYLDYGSGLTGVHIDLVTNQITCEEFRPGVLQDLQNLMTQSEAKIVIHGKPALSAATADIGRLQTQVQTSTGRNLGPRVYLYYSPTDDQGLYRTRVYGIDFATEQPATFYKVPDRFLKATLTITHGPWEGELTQIPLTNAYGTDDLSATGLRIDNTLDATRDNTLQINDEDIIGDLPAPVRLEITNNSATGINRYFVSNNVNATPFSLVHVIEGEAGTPLINIANADASSGNTNQINIAVLGGAEMTWVISETVAGYLNSNQFHIIVKFHLGHIKTETYMRFRTEDITATYNFWVGDWVKFPNSGTDYTYDYGVAKLPPWRLDTGASSGSFNLVMELELGAGELTYDVDIDALYLFPVDSYRNIVIPYYMSPTYRLVDDMIEDDAWTDLIDITNNYTKRIGNVIGIGSEILVHPHRNQKLYILCAENSGDDPDLTNNVRILYRPVRLAI